VRVCDHRARPNKVQGGYEITGRKVFISNGSVAEYTVVFAALDRKDPLSSWTAFLVREDNPGFRVARVENKMGQRACPAAEIELERAFVPDDCLVGDEGGGAALSRQTLAVSRGPVGAIATGIARDAYEAASEYLRGVRTDGAASRGEPWMDDALARMAVDIRAARATYLEAALHVDQVLLPDRRAQRAAGLISRIPVIGHKIVGALAQNAGRGLQEAWAHQCVLGATAKITGSDAAMRVTTTALDLIPPGTGELRARAEKAFRDAKLTQIYEGTNQINLRAVAHESWLRRADLLA
jgi:alkylation response protein AidB-like acyl-CoA dehydrogenase